ncbi:MAG: tetratricopeptide repeat protein [Candidatus Eisenbacteria bacterium]
MNDATAESCAKCNFPLQGIPGAGPLAGMTPPGAASVADPAPAGAAPTETELRRVRPIRRRPPRSGQDPMSQQLWMVVGGIAIALLVWQAFTGFHQSNSPPTAGAKPDQQKVVDQARAAIAKDSLDLQAQIMLADVLYDTANWSEAVVHYRTANRIDPTRVTTVVDLGVCYYNLGDPITAKTLFEKALTLDPQQPVALFNLGIVAEAQKDDALALDYFRRAKAANPPPGMMQPLSEHERTVTERMGTSQPPSRRGR